MWRALIANVGIAAVLAATLLFVGWLTLSGRVPLSAAGVAVAGVALVGERLTMAGYAAGSLAESARYVDDYLTFVELLPRVRQAEPHDPAPGSFAEIAVDEVTFQYPTATEPGIGRRERFRQDHARETLGRPLSARCGNHYVGQH
jgi:ATP-binding cassette subfamily B protein